MPDPVLYLQAMAAAASAGAAIALVIGWVRRPAGAARMNLACVGGMVLGLAVGYEVLRLRPAWPPANGLGRFLWIVMPAVVGIETIAAMERTPRWFAWSLRLPLVGSIGRILLHGSVYLVGADRQWTARQAVVALSLSGAALAIAWALLLWLARRSAGISISLALAEASLCGGAVIMLAGYLSGGAAALPLTAALAGVAVASCLIGERLEMQGAIGIGIVGLFSLLFIGRFFGGLSTASALAMFFAPLLCWATEIPALRTRKPWLVGSLRLVLVAIPLLAVFAAAKREFDRSGLAQGELPPRIEDRKSPLGAIASATMAIGASF
ncbi:MAG TPA: hypothetical protein VN699_14140 [Pirellulales bacterium]|nr:hypothetical protein [Pirellulales bacterium]